MVKLTRRQLQELFNRKITRKGVDASGKGFILGIKLVKKLKEQDIRKAQAIKFDSQTIGFKVKGKNIKFSTTKVQTPSKAGRVRGVIRGIEFRKSQLRR